MMIRSFAIAAAATLVAGAAFADLASTDADGDGLVTFQEMVVVYPDVTEDVFLTVDTNADGGVDQAEWDAATAAGTIPAE